MDESREQRARRPPVYLLAQSGLPADRPVSGDNHVENPFIALTFIAGPAVLTNACAILQNSATMRYTMALTQWREFRAALAAGDNSLGSLYADAGIALRLAERRIRLVPQGLNLVYAAVGLGPR